MNHGSSTPPPIKGPATYMLPGEPGPGAVGVAESEASRRHKLQAQLALARGSIGAAVKQVKSLESTLHDIVRRNREHVARAAACPICQHRSIA